MARLTCDHESKARRSSLVQRLSDSAAVIMQQTSVHHQHQLAVLKTGSSLGPIRRNHKLTTVRSILLNVD